MNPIKFSSLRTLLAFQLIIIIIFSIFFWFGYGNEAGLSSLFGGIIAIFPNLLFALIYFRYSGAMAAKKVVQSFYLGEILKLLTTLILFTVVFQWSKLKALPLFVVYIVTLMTYWLILAVQLGRKK